MAGSSNLGETLLGAAVIATALGFFFYAANVSGAGSGSISGYNVTAEFENAAGISVGTDVRLAGIKVGTVTNMSLNKESYQATVAMSLDNSVQLADDSSAKIASEGLLGGSFISLEPGGADTKLADGGTIQYTQGAVDIWSLISQAMFDRNKSPDAGTAPQQQGQ